MSKEFWLTAGWLVIAFCVLGALGSLYYYHDRQLAMFLGFVGVGVGGFLLDLGRGSKSRAERRRETSGL